MPSEAKPLFRPDVVRQHARALPLPLATPETRSKLSRWAGLIKSGEIREFGEREILPDLITDLFQGLLGYTGPAGSPGRHTLSREQLVQAEGEFADAVLGELHGPNPRYVVAVEGKGPGDPLDRPHGGRRMSAVDQAYRYAINLPCDWIIVTNLREVRLYCKNADQHTYESFEVERLAAEEEQLRRFVFLLGAERIVPLSGRCHLYSLLEESARVGDEVTRDFYRRYAGMRQDLFERVRQANPAVGAGEALRRSSREMLPLERPRLWAICVTLHPVMRWWLMA